MVRSFFKPIPRNDTTYLDLPPCYDLSYPVGPVLLTTDDDRIWGVTVEQNSNSFQITTGWSKVVKDLQIVVGDFVVFEWFEHITFRVTLLKDVQTKDVSNKFPFWLIIPARNRMFLPEDYVEHHFKDMQIPHPVVIRFGDVYQWTVLLQWYLIGYFFSDGWNDVYKDLKWRIGDFLMFEKVADYEFKLDFFREDGMRVDPDEIGNEADEVIEVIEVSSDESEDGDSQNNNAVPDHEVTKKVTKKFRFPIAFGKECEFEDLQSLRIEVEDGMSIIKKLRVEGSGSKRRFAIREWKSCMKKLRIRNGRLYRIMYFEMEAMAEENVTMLNALSLNDNDCKIKVKILKVWRRKMNGEENKFYSIEMILMDEEGNKIHASCLHRFFFRFEKFFIEDDCLLIKKPSLAEIADNKSNFQLVNNDHKLTFYISTTVKKCNNWTGPEHGFGLTDFKSILGKSSDAGDNKPVGSVIDLIGYVLICYDIEDTVTKLGPGKRVNLKLNDLDDEELGVTLWDDFAIEMHSFMTRKDRDKDVFLLIQFGSVKLHQDKRTVSNAFSATKLFINSAVDEIVTFKERYLAKYANSRSLSGNDSGSLMATSDEDLFLGSEYSPLAFLSIIDEEKHVVVVATIKGICNKNLWYYQACTVCHCKVEKEFTTIENADGVVDIAERKYKCSNNKCSAEKVKADYRFKIPVIVQDATGSVSLTLFNRESIRLLRKTAEAIVNRQEQADEFEEFPTEFKDLIGKRFAFHIKVTKYNVDHHVEYYAINKLSNDCEILKKLEEKHAIEKNDVDDINGASPGDQQNTQVSLKDAQSSTDENVTPMSAVAEDAHKNKHVDLKRNLEEVYKEDDPTVPKVIEADQKEDGIEADTKDERRSSRASAKKKMLVPKKEK